MARIVTLSEFLGRPSRRPRLVLRKGVPRPGLVLVPSKSNPRVKRWQRTGEAAPAARSRAAAPPEEPAPATKPWVESLPHLPADTLTHFTKPGQAGEIKSSDQLVPQRQALHQQIMSHFLDRARPVPRDQKPEALVMMGGPASGKTTATKHLNFDKSKFVNLNADDIKEELPEYREAVDGRARNAAALVHEESSMLMKQIREKALGDRKNIIMDGTGAKKDGPGGYLAFVQRLKDLGYHVTVVMPDLDADTAKQRADARAEKSGRYVPHHFIDDAYSKIPHNFIPIASQADDFHLYDARPYPPKRVWSKENGQETIHDPEFVDRFRSSYGQDGMTKGVMMAKLHKGDKPRNVGPGPMRELVEKGMRALHDEDLGKPKRFKAGDGVREVLDDAAVED